MKNFGSRLDNIITESIHKLIYEMSPRPMKEMDAFKMQANEVHNNKYNYDKVVYRGTDEPVIITCPQHGDFPQTPHHHLGGQGCPSCVRQYKLEIRTAEELNKRNIEYIKDGTPFEWLGRLELDFYIPSLNIAIECQGIQHFQPRQRFGGEETYRIQMERDQRKAQLCKEHNLPLFFISYKEYRNIPSIIDNIIHNSK